MSFRVSSRTLERLEWPEVASRLRERSRTPRARSLCERSEALFATSADEASGRLAETGEARALLDEGGVPPLGGVQAVEPLLARAAKGGVLAGRELLELLSTLDALHATRRFLADRADEAPRLADIALTIVEARNLAADIEWALESDGQVRDEASPVLAEARRESHRLASELERRLTRTLHDPEISACLSDSFVTMRNDRFVLPVRADSRRRVRGIVHDVSSSGTTFFIEPEGVVELNNRMKQADLEAEREVVRILRDLSAQAARERDEIEASLTALETIDLAFARGHVSQDMDAVAPRVGNEALLRLEQLRHPLLDPESVVPNDLHIGDGFTVLLVSGPNAGGKTVAMKAAALSVLMVRAGMHVPAASGARVDLFDQLLADIGDAQNLAENLSTFSAHLANQARILESADDRSLVVLDEVGTGTDPSEGAALAQALLEALADAGARVIATTHYNLLKEMANVDPRFENASVEFDPETLAPTYRLHLGVPGSSSATALAGRMGLRPEVVTRARAILDGEDRGLDRMLSELATLRGELDRERGAAQKVRAESEAARSEYLHKLELLKQRREKLLESMGRDLEDAFRDAHGQIAQVIRTAQRSGSARDAARARERLLELESSADEARERAAPAPEEPPPAIDWENVEPGRAVRLVGGGRGELLTRPDKRGRVAVQIGSARVVLDQARIEGLDAAAPAASRRKQPVQVDLRGAAATTVRARLDLRGERVADALDRLAAQLDRAASTGSPEMVIVHGLGTGALRDAVRDYLRQSPYVRGARAADPEEGGDGVTIAELS